MLQPELRPSPAGSLPDWLEDRSGELRRLAADRTKGLLTRAILAFFATIYAALAALARQHDRGLLRPHAECAPVPGAAKPAARPVPAHLSVIRFSPDQV